MRKCELESCLKLVSDWLLSFISRLLTIPFAHLLQVLDPVGNRGMSNKDHAEAQVNDLAHLILFVRFLVYLSEVFQHQLEHIGL